MAIYGHSIRTGTHNAPSSPTICCQCMQNAASQVMPLTCLFDRMTQRNLVSWTALISGYSQNLESNKAVSTFCEMRGSGERTNEFAFSSVVQGCTGIGSVWLGRQMHCLAVKSWFSCELFVGSNLTDLYSICGLMVEACLVFKEMVCKDEVSWTAMIDGFAKNGEFEQALIASGKMLCEESSHNVFKSIVDRTRGFPSSFPKS